MRNRKAGSTRGRSRSRVTTRSTSRGTVRGRGTEASDVAENIIARASEGLMSSRRETIITEDNAINEFKELSYLFLELTMIINGLHLREVRIDLLRLNGDFRKNFDVLMESIQLFSEKRPKNTFVKGAFRLPLHLVSHMIDKRHDIGYYPGSACFTTERAMKSTRNMVFFAGNVYNTLMNRHSSSCFLRLDYLSHCEFETTLLNYDSIKKKQDLRRANSSILSEYSSLTGDCSRADIRFAINLETRGTEARLDKPGKEFAKIKIDNIWTFVKIKKIIHLESFYNERYLIEYHKVELEKTWKASKSEMMDYCVFTNVIIDENAEIEKLWLDDNKEMFAVNVFYEYENALYDTNACFYDLWRQHT